MTARGPQVVLLWGLGNAALMLVLAGFGGDAMVLWLYGGASALVGLFAVAALASSRRRPEPATRYRRPTGGESALLGALGCLLAGLTVVFGYWYLPLAVLFLLPAAAAAVVNRPPRAPVAARRPAP